MKRKKAVNQEKHGPQCTLCPHPQRSEIEGAYFAWRSIASICRAFGIHRDSLARHIRAMGLFEKRLANTEAILGMVAENLAKQLGRGRIRVSVRDGIAAIIALKKINGDGVYAARSEITVRHYIQDLSLEELLHFEQTGKPPERLEKAIAEAYRKQSERLEGSEIN